MKILSRCLAPTVVLACAAVSLLFATPRHLGADALSIAGGCYFQAFLNSSACPAGCDSGTYDVPNVGGTGTKVLLPDTPECGGGATGECLMYKRWQIDVDPNCNPD